MLKILDPQYGNDFIGREEKIKELKRKVEKNGIVVVTGDRGIGKTNLILVVKEDMGKEKECHFVNGSLFYEEMGKIFKPPWYKRIHGFSASLIAGGGISWDPMKPFILEYMEKSEEKMIFVENAQEMDKKALETIFDASRRNDRLRFVLEIATPYMPDVKLRVSFYEIVELDELSDKSIEKIVRIDCPNFSDVIVKRIVSLSKGYPYVARSLAYICDNKDSEEEIPRFLNTLRDEDMKYNLNKIHGEVLATLDADSKAAIKRLAVAPETLTLNLIAAFCGDDVDPSLTDLSERGILIKSEEKIYRIYHPLFREYLRSIQPVVFKTKQGIYSEALEKVKGEFDSIYILFEVLNEPFFEGLLKQTEHYEALNSVGIQAYTWGKLEHAFSAWMHLFELAKTKDKAWESSAMGNIGIVYQTKGDLDKALEYYGWSLKINEELGRKEGMASNYVNIGNVYQTQGDLETALEYYGKSLELDEELGWKVDMAITLGNMGLVYLTRGEYDRALEYFVKALKLNEEQGRKGGIAKQLGNIGYICADKGKLDSALKYFEKALELVEALGNKGEIAAQLGSIGVVYLYKGELEKALEFFEKALREYEELESKKEIAIGSVNIGIVYLSKGEPDKALEYFERALKLDEYLKSKDGMAVDFVNIGKVYRNKGELDKALEYFEKALKLVEYLKSKEGIAHVFGDIGIVYGTKGEFDRALECFEKALKLADELKVKKGIAVQLGNMGNVYLTKGDFDKARGYFGKALQIFKEIGGRIETARTLMNIGDVFIQKGNKERALDHYLEAQDLVIGYDSPLFGSINERITKLLKMG